MPILAVPFVEQQLVARDLSMVDTRTLAFRSLDGRYPFSVDDRTFIFGPDSEGLDMPPRQIITRAIPGMEGERLTEIRVDKREVFLPFVINSAASGGHLAHLAMRDELAQLFNHRRNDYRADDGTLDLVATSARGERSLRCTYVDGMTATRAPSERAYHQRLGVTLWAVRPYWSGQQWSTPVIRIPDQGDWFDTFPGVLTSSSAIGQDLQVTVEGDAESWATVDLVGPASSVVITGPGLSVTISGGLSAGEQARIVTNPRGRTAKFSGIKDWSRVAASDRYRPLNPGDNVLNVSMIGATGQSSAVVFGSAQFERPW